MTRAHCKEAMNALYTCTVLCTHTHTLRHLIFVFNSLGACCWSSHYISHPSTPFQHRIYFSLIFCCCTFSSFLRSVRHSLLFTVFHPFFRPPTILHCRISVYTWMTIRDYLRVRWMVQCGGVRCKEIAYADGMMNVIKNFQDSQHRKKK